MELKLFCRICVASGKRRSPSADEPTELLDVARQLTFGRLEITGGTFLSDASRCPTLHCCFKVNKLRQFVLELSCNDTDRGKPKSNQDGPKWSLIRLYDSVETISEFQFNQTRHKRPPSKRLNTIQLS